MADRPAAYVPCSRCRAVAVAHRRGDCLAPWSCPCRHEAVEHPAVVVARWRLPAGLHRPAWHAQDGPGSARAVCGQPLDRAGRDGAPVVDPRAQLAATAGTGVAVCRACGAGLIAAGAPRALLRRLVAA